jgi:hypothetical protein
MAWKKRGLVYAPDGADAWRRSHASLPVAVPRGDGVHRVLCANRDDRNRSHVGWVDVALPEGRVVGVARRPALAPGGLGCFDDHGVYPGSLVEHGGRLYLFYVGWNPGARPPLFYASIGLAVSDDGGESFERISRGPVLARSEVDPCLVTSPCVLLDEGRWRMWYVSGIRWDEEGKGGAPRSWYHVQYAESEDGRTWRSDGHVAIGLTPGERNLARPWVVRDGHGYRMWYGRSGDDGYRMGYAESGDGLAWTRRDDRAGIEPSKDGWDDEAVTYPWVGDADGTPCMLYNGNGFGRTGFGLAVAAG